MLSRLFRVSMVILTVAGLALLAVAVAVPRIGGATPYVVQTGSMSPTLEPGTLVVVKPRPAHELRIGDVVTYQLVSGRPATATHRVVEIGAGLDGELRFRTQGDANSAADAAWVRPAQLRGVVWYHLPWVGRISVALDPIRHQGLERVVGWSLVLVGASMVVGALRGRPGRGPGRRPGRHRHRAVA